ncbi:hypothetical protein [Variovorax sp. PAMC 28711]|uniref:hypothetical protein n=1 Tax=Variovorax sp. PAMC 28711 TaxID=1795631 RepID=UPI00078DDFDA|nr:hypothetical protein [Variovorax sp. PAMC 28711]AMM22985.1 hypothetical protein AX767_00270 [Variovorax sp. PAMC 28711]
MASLLDFLSSDEAALGLGLLAAGGPTTDPNAAGFGASLARGVGNVAANKHQRLQNSLLQSQVDENKSQAAQRSAALARQQQMDQYYMGGAGATAPVAAGAPGAGASPTAGEPVAPGAVLHAAVGKGPNDPPPPQGKFAEWSKQFNIPADALVADYMSNGGKGIADMLFKAGRPDMKTNDGYAYDANRVQPGFLPGLKQSANGVSTLVLPDPSAPGGVRIQAPQGALGTAGAYAAQDALIRAQATPGRPTIMDGGRMGGQSQAQEIGLAPPAGGATPAPLIGRAGPTNTSEAAMAAGTRTDMGFNPDAARREIAAAQRDLVDPAKAKFLTPQDRSMLQEHIATTTDQLARYGGAAAPAAPVIGRLPAAAPATAGVSGGGLEFSPAEKAQQAAQMKTAEGTAAADVVRDTEGQKKVKSAGQMIAAADRAITLLKQGPTASGVGELLDKGMNLVGQSNKGAEISAQLDIVAGDLVNNVPRMEGPQSDGDRLEYKLQAGRAADRSIPVAQRLAAAQEVKRLQGKYANLNGGPAESSGGASGTFAPLPSGWSVKVK